MLRILLWAVLLTACSRTPLPDLPVLHLDNFQPAVRAAIENAWQAAKAAPRDSAACGRLGMVLHAHQQWGAAEACYARAQALDPDNFAWPYYLGVIYAEMGKPAASRQALERALKIDPKYLPARVALAGRLLEAGELEAAESVYRDLVAARTSNATVLYGLGRVQMGRGQAEALATLRTAVQQAPEFGAAHYALAQALRKAGRESEAASHLKIYEAHKLDAPPLPDARIAEVLALNRGAAHFIRQGIDLEAQGRLGEAIQAHRAALDAEPKSVQAQVNLIQLYSRAGQPLEAEAAYRAAIALSPGSAEAHYNYGVFAFAQKKLAEAAKAFERAIASNPQHAAAHNNLGFLLDSLGRVKEAERHYRLALSNDPGYRMAHFHLGRLLATQRRWPEAIQELKETVQTDDENTPGCIYALGSVYARSGDIRNAVERLQQARAQAERYKQAPLVAAIDRDLAAMGRSGIRR
ncbi:MAG: tetratricopeptide repeat protein [Acidobacteriia bacterium]|nr:tetratricopeptide repeat protein [Terriglobia bacterium]